MQHVFKISSRYSIQEKDSLSEVVFVRNKGSVGLYDLYRQYVGQAIITVTKIDLFNCISVTPHLMQFRLGLPVNRFRRFS